MPVTVDAWEDASGLCSACEEALLYDDFAYDYEDDE